MGLFITVEGPNGIGKTTFIENLKHIVLLQYDVLLTKEPTATKFGDYVRKNEGGIEREAYAYLIAADRSYHLEKYIEPALEMDKMVICDRYIESSFVLQMFDGVDASDIWRLNCKFRVPDLSIILLGTEQVLEQRLSTRSELTHFEKKMTRRDEIERYQWTGNYLKNKGFNIIILNNNTEVDLDSNLNNVMGIIDDLERRKQNEQKS